MPRTNETAYLIWSLTASGQGTTITTSGNSGSYTATTPNARTAVDLRWTDDVWLSISATAGAGTSLTVQVDGYDDQGNLFAQLLKATLASSPGTAVVFAGRHGGASTSYAVFPEWGRVSWALTGSMTGCEICLYGR
jgi:hypothetical protein